MALIRPYGPNVRPRVVLKPRDESFGDVPNAADSCSPGSSSNDALGAADVGHPRVNVPPFA